jgi:hypothetical protein
MVGPVPTTTETHNIDQDDTESGYVISVSPCISDKYSYLLVRNFTSADYSIGMVAMTPERHTLQEVGARSRGLRR